MFVANESNSVSITEIDTVGSGRVRLYKTPFFKIPEIDHAIYPKIPKLIRNNHYDLIQVNEENEINNFLVSRLARKLQIPVVVYQGMYQPLSGRLRSAFQKLYDKTVLPLLRRNISLAVAKTTRAERHLLNKGFKQTTVIPVGLDPSPFQESRARDWRAEFSVPTDHKLLLYVGIFESRRNIHLLLDIAKRLSYRPITLLMAGDGPLQDEVNARITDESISNVKLLGSIEQHYLPSLYRAADLFLLASTYEIYGMVVLEAMYFGTPNISSRTAGPEDIISDEIDGVLLDNFEIDTWANKIDDILFRQSRQTEMSKAAEQKIREQLTWDVIADRYHKEVILPLVSDI